jgi:hypothetical protein
MLKLFYKINVKISHVTFPLFFPLFRRLFRYFSVSKKNMSIVLLKTLTLKKISGFPSIFLSRFFMFLGKGSKKTANNIKKKHQPWYWYFFGLRGTNQPCRGPSLCFSSAPWIYPPAGCWARLGICLRHLHVQGTKKRALGCMALFSAGSTHNELAGTSGLVAA